jgi:hypothetical protein
MKIGGKDAVLVGLLVIVVWLCLALVRVENQRYALAVGMCRDSASGVADWKCLRSVQTRTSWLWHLYYALADD